MQRRSSLPFTVLLVVLLMSCGTQLPGAALDCMGIMEDSLRSLDFDALERDLMPRWVIQHYDLDPSSIEIREYYNDLTALAWQQQGRKYSAYFLEKRLVQIHASWKSPSSTGNEILECFGESTLYRSRLYLTPETYASEMEFWYPEQGVIVSASRFPTDYSLAVLTDGTASWWDLTEVTVVRPNPPEKMITDMLLFQTDAQRDKVLQSLKPWPGKWEDVVVDNEIEPIK